MNDNKYAVRLFYEDGSTRVLFLDDKGLMLFSEAFNNSWMFYYNGLNGLTWALNLSMVTEYNFKVVCNSVIIPAYGLYLE